MIRCAGKHIKTCVNLSLSDFPRSIKTRIARILKSRAAEQSFLVYHSHIGGRDIRFHILIKRGIIPCAVLLLTCGDESIVNKIISHGNDINLCVGCNRCLRHRLRHARSRSIKVSFFSNITAYCQSENNRYG